jgi:5-methyltetrahydropteroyltriglutamate--homocysteine methyltransferase
MEHYRSEVSGDLGNDPMRCEVRKVIICKASFLDSKSTADSGMALDYMAQHLATRMGQTPDRRSQHTGEGRSGLPIADAGKKSDVRAQEINALRECRMKRSTERFLTTHTGSLPRPDDLVRMMYAKEEGVPVDRAALAVRVREAVAEVVKRQIEAGIDLVGDGELSKPSYATYIKDRLDGFGGTGNTFVYQDLAEFPRLAQRVFGDPGRSRRKTPACNGAIGVRDGNAAQADADNLKAAIVGTTTMDAFISAASPGVVSLFFRNDYYQDHETYLHAIAEAMRHEYETVAKAGLVLQIDCPDLGMGRHIQFANLSLEEFRKRARMHVEALNHALVNIPAEQLRMHLCWGNYEGPHHCDVPLADIIDVVFLAKPHAILLEAANPRHAHEWALFENVKLPDGKVLIPGVIESKSNFIEHPELIAQRIGRYAKLVGREHVIAGSDCGYGTWVGQAAVDPDVVWAKFAALTEGARIATRQFWK